MRQLTEWVGGKIVLLGSGFHRGSPCDTVFHSLQRKRLVDAGRRGARECHQHDSHGALPVACPGMAALARPVPGYRSDGSWYCLALTSGTVPEVLTGVGAATFIGTHVFFQNGIVLPTAEFLAAWLFAMFGAIIYRNVTAERKKRVLPVVAVALFVGKQVARNLDESQQLGLTGKRLAVTILFTDIRGFTAFCEEKDPAVVVELLNEYMGCMVSIIHQYRGHVNKFIGDGILAVFCDDDLHGQPGNLMREITRDPRHQLRHRDGNRA